MALCFRRRKELTLEQIGYLGAVIEKARQTIFPRLEDQVVKQMQRIQAGPLIYTTESSYFFGDVHPYFGGGTVRTHTEGTVTKKDGILSLDAVVQYQYEDTFTDPENIRQSKYGTSSPKGLPSWEVKKTDFLGTYFKITGEWKTKLTGSIKNQ